MRLKHVKGASEKIEQSNMVIHDFNNYRGHFDKVFEEKQPLHIEIGMGKGDFIIGMAHKYPDINFIGIEKYDSVLVRALDKIEMPLPNLKFIRMDAVNIDNVFEHEVDTIYLNFSDPWPKKRHAHRRLSSPVFLKRYEKLFQSEQRIIMKTDNRKLFEYSLISMNECGYHFDEISLNLYQDNVEDNVQTEYEKKFHDLGFPIYKISVYK